MELALAPGEAKGAFLPAFVHVGSSMGLHLFAPFVGRGVPALLLPFQPKLLPALGADF